jgi:hypothetical protein
MVGDVNALDDQHLSLFSNFTDRFASQPPLSCRNIARLQRAAQGAGQSTGRGGYHIIQRGSVGLVDILINAVVLGDFGVDAKKDRLRLRRKIGSAQRAFHPFDAYVRAIHGGISHRAPRFSKRY